MGGMKRAGMIAVLAMIAVLGARAEEKFADLKFQVLKADTGKPIRNASVILHSVDKKGKQESGGLQMKTDPQGNCAMPGIPYGTLRVQVLATGFQTFGEDYEINQPTHDFVIKLKRPQSQYSIYEEHPKQEKKPQDKPKQ